MTQTQFAADAFAVQRLGARAWLDGQGWPIRDRDYFAFLDKAYDLFDDLIGNVSAEVADLFCADTSYFGTLLQQAHYRAVANYCRVHDWELLSGAWGQVYLQPNWSKLGDLAGDASLPSRVVRQHVKRWQFNSHLPLSSRLGAVAGRSTAWVLGSFGALQRDFAEKHGLACDFPSLEEFTAVATAPGTAAEKAADISKELCAALDRCARSIIQGGLDVERAAGTWNKRIAALARVRRAVETRRVPGCVLVGEIGRPMQRMVGLAARGKGSRIYGFHHGNAVMDYWRRTTKYTDYLPVDTFVCPTEGIAEQNRLFARANPPPRGISFEVVDTGRYHRLITEGRQQATRPVRTVMVVGMPMVALRHQFAWGNFFAHMLAFDLKALEMLRQAGFRTIYKMHPEAVAECGKLFEGKADVVSTAKFEDVYKTADAYVFGTTTSTTFGFILMSNRPVVALDVDGTPWNALTRPLLEQRVHFVPAHFDERGWLKFDSRQLIDALTFSRSIDTEFVDTIMGSP